MTIMPNTSRSSRIMSKTEDALRKELNCALRNPRFTSSVWMRLRVASPPLKEVCQSAPTNDFRRALANFGWHGVGGYGGDR